MKVRIVKTSAWLDKTVDIPDDALAITIQRDSDVLARVSIYWLEK